VHVTCANQVLPLRRGNHARSQPRDSNNNGMPFRLHQLLAAPSYWVLHAVPVLNSAPSRDVSPGQIPPHVPPTVSTGRRRRLPRVLSHAGATLRIPCAAHIRLNRRGRALALQHLGCLVTSTRDAKLNKLIPPKRKKDTEPNDGGTLAISHRLS
jgi:hypothetical protein